MSTKKERGFHERSTQTCYATITTPAHMVGKEGIEPSPPSVRLSLVEDFT